MKLKGIRAIKRKDDFWNSYWLSHIVNALIGKLTGVRPPSHVAGVLIRRIVRVRPPPRIANHLIEKRTGHHPELIQAMIFLLFYFFLFFPIFLLWSQVRLHDYGCCLKAYRASVVRSLRLYGELHRYLPALAAMEGASICEIPVRTPKHP